MKLRPLYPGADILVHGTVHDIVDMWNKIGDGQLGQLSCDQGFYTTMGTKEGKHTASKSRHLIHSLRFLYMIYSQAALPYNTNIAPPSLTSSLHLEIPRLQSLKHSIRIIRSTYLNQSLPIRLPVPAKDILARGRVVLIDVFVIQPRSLRGGDGVGDKGVGGERDAGVISGGGPGYGYVDHWGSWGC